jgi:hypothetical protein
MIVTTTISSVNVKPARRITTPRMAALDTTDSILISPRFRRSDARAYSAALSLPSVLGTDDLLLAAPGASEVARFVARAFSTTRPASHRAIGFRKTVLVLDPYLRPVEVEIELAHQDLHDLAS